MESLSCFICAASETFCAASCECCGYGVLDATDGDGHGACMTGRPTLLCPLLVVMMLLLLHAVERLLTLSVQ